jgi:hypothetical protein
MKVATRSGRLRPPKIVVLREVIHHLQLPQVQNLWNGRIDIEGRGCSTYAYSGKLEHDHIGV